MAKRQVATDEMAAVIGYSELAGKTMSSVAKLVTSFDPESVVRAGWQSALEMIADAEALLEKAKQQARSGKDMCGPELELTQGPEAGPETGAQADESGKASRSRKAANG